VDCKDAKEIEQKNLLNAALELLAQSLLKHYCKPHSVTKDCGEKV